MRGQETPREKAAAVAEMRDRPEDGAPVIQISRHTYDWCLAVLKATVAAWASEAHQGDGIAEEHMAIFERARLLSGWEGSVLCPVANAWKHDNGAPLRAGAKEESR